MSADPWGDPPDSFNPPPVAVATVDKPLTKCPVPNCDAPPMAVNALGPHIAMHRRRGDPGTPPPKSKPKSKVNDAPSKRGPYKPRGQRLSDPEQIADGVLALLYPETVPTDRLRDVAAWVAATDRLATEALADRQP